MNFAAFDLNLLRVFDALMRERSATRAGDAVGLSQPAVSAALNRLRLLLDDQLFIRRGNEMAPTPRAEALAGPVRESLRQIETALVGDARFEPGAAERLFTVLGADFFSVVLLPRLAERLAAEAPGVRVRFVDSSRGPVDRLLLEDAIDVALERPMETRRWISIEPLFDSPFVAVAAKGHPALAAAGVAPGETIPLDLFCSRPHAMRTVEGDMRGQLDEALAAAGRSRRVVLAAPQFQAVLEAVSRSGLLAALPRQYADLFAAQAGVCVYQCPVEVPIQEIRMYWHRRHDANPAHLWFRSRILEALRAAGVVRTGPAG